MREQLTKKDLSKVKGGVSFDYCGRCDTYYPKYSNHKCPENQPSGGSH